MTIKKCLSIASIGVMLAMTPGFAYADGAGDPLKKRSQLFKTGQGAAAGQEDKKASEEGASGGLSAGAIAAAVAVAAAVAIAVAAISDNGTSTTATTSTTSTTATSTTTTN